MTVPATTTTAPETPDTRKVALGGLTPEEIASLLEVKPFQGNQIFRWIHQKCASDFDAMTDLSKALRAKLAAMACVHESVLLKMSESPQSFTRKALLSMRDGETVESVFLRDHSRVTLCLSSQAGCPVKCAFCATGIDGFRRNLEVSEIVEQALHLLDGVDLDGQTPNLVFMGMGEPFLNYDAFVKAIGILMHKDGLGVGARKITVSTAGHVPGIERFAREGWQVRLAVSLHAADNDLRSRLVPMNRKYPLEDLMRAIHGYVRTTGRHVSFEYVLIKDINDRPADAGRLARLLHGLDATVNLIPYNPVAGASFAAPAQRRCETFCGSLVHFGVNATLRREKGGDIDAACGQLRRLQEV